MKKPSPFSSLPLVLMVGFLVLTTGCKKQADGNSLLHDAIAPPVTQTTKVYFSPKGGCTAAAVAEINKAVTSIHIQAYSFTSKEIAQAVVDAHKRGVQIIVILDKSNEKEAYSSGKFLFDMGITVWVDSKHAIAHSKIILIDNQVIITGSFNFTEQAEHSNAENMLVITGNPSLYSQYEQNFQNHLSHSDHYVVPSGEDKFGAVAIETR